VLLAQGFVKDGDSWYVKNREWFPDALNENSIAIIYERDANGKPTDLGFCSKTEFSELYTDSDKYKSGQIIYLDANKIPMNQVISATKCASGEFVFSQKVRF